VFVAAALAACAPAWAGPIVLLRSGDLAPYRAAEEGLRAATHEPVVVVEVTSGTPEQVARAVFALHPDAVVAVGLRAATLARDWLPRVPIVYCAVPQPERHDLVGDWLTGVRSDVEPSAEIAALRLAHPTVRSVGYLVGAGADPAVTRRAKAAARAAGITFVEAMLASAADLPAATRRVASQVDAFWMPADPMVATPEGFRFLLAFSLASRKPLLAFSDALVRKGALVAVMPDYSEAGTLAAQQVRRIQAGDRPVDLPVPTVARMHTFMNQATAKALGAALSAAALRASEVVP
jgi:ABC-type uncharacterized transport system substrate-binding protein